jgi:hypothetical protein
MEAHAGEIERKMKRLFDWLSEKDRRRNAAIEAWAGTLPPPRVSNERSLRPTRSRRHGERPKTRAVPGTVGSCPLDRFAAGCCAAV